MKVSMTKFYREVTGRTTANRATTGAALTRWGVPFTERAGGKGDVVDIAHLESARAKWQQEVANGEARKRPTKPGEPDAMLIQIDDKINELIGRFDQLLSALTTKKR